ncbi:uncharacterized protein PFLUO_LOCUS2488 [Penicillium psychrofluorescens]|uniref:uncharacterized protein n=1 Tax=Penicillium psychrofluorescens TaxID=3158075 RepID=UPI003CCD5487
MASEISTNKVYVVTGANRGLGLGLTKTLLSRPSTTVIATVRNDEAAASLQADHLKMTDTGQGSALHIIQLDFTAALSPDEIFEGFSKTVSTIDHIDVLINNAGFAAPMHPATQTPAEDLRASFEVNTIAPLMVFQAFWPLLQKSPSGAPKVILISSSVGSIRAQEPMTGGAYGPSKAAANWLVRALHLQNEDKGLVAVALHPGWVQTRNGHFAAKEWNYPSDPPDTVEDSVKGMLEVIDGATRENISGEFVAQTGEVIPW